MAARLAITAAAQKQQAPTDFIARIIEGQCDEPVHDHAKPYYLIISSPESILCIYEYAANWTFVFHLTYFWFKLRVYAAFYLVFRARSVAMNRSKLTTTLL
jgi:hypothetical protein